MELENAANAEELSKVRKEKAELRVSIVIRRYVVVEHVVCC